jgi:hypothetical protein
VVSQNKRQTNTDELLCKPLETKMHHREPEDNLEVSQDNYSKQLDIMVHYFEV